MEENKKPDEEVSTEDPPQKETPPQSWVKGDGIARSFFGLGNFWRMCFPGSCSPDSHSGPY